MKKKVNFTFTKIEKDKNVELQDYNFDLIYHHDVMEHTRKPCLLAPENYWLLKPNRTLFFVHQMYLDFQAF